MGNLQTKRRVGGTGDTARSSNGHARNIVGQSASLDGRARPPTARVLPVAVDDPLFDVRDPDLGHSAQLWSSHRAELIDDVSSIVAGVSFPVGDEKKVASEQEKITVDQNNINDRRAASVVRAGATAGWFSRTALQGEMAAQRAATDWHRR